MFDIAVPVGDDSWLILRVPATQKPHYETCDCRDGPRAYCEVDINTLCDAVGRLVHEVRHRDMLQRSYFLHYLEVMVADELGRP